MSSQEAINEITTKHKNEMDDVLKSVQDELFGKALKLIQAESLNSVQTIIQHRDQLGDARISLDAAKYLTKLAGLEVERHELGGQGGEPLTMVIHKYQDNAN